MQFRAFERVVHVHLAAVYQQCKPPRSQMLQNPQAYTLIPKTLQCLLTFLSVLAATASARGYMGHSCA